MTKQKNKKSVEIVKSLCLFDNDFMRAALNHKGSLELVLSIILHRKIRIKEYHTEHEMFSLHGRAVTFDAYVVTMDGLYIDLEVQDDNKGAIPKRANYHASILNDNVDPPGTQFKDIKRTMVIFITKKDYLKGRKPLYHIPRIVKETGKVFRDGTEIIYVNGANCDDSKLGWLMHDFACTDCNQMHYKVLKKQSEKFKKGKGLNIMCRKVERYAREVGKEIAKQEVKQVKIEAEKKAKQEVKQAKIEAEKKAKQEVKQVKIEAEKKTKEAVKHAEIEAEKKKEIELIHNVMNINRVGLKAAMNILGISVMRQKEYLATLV